MKESLTYLRNPGVLDDGKWHSGKGAKHRLALIYGKWLKSIWKTKIYGSKRIVRKLLKSYGLPSWQTHSMPRSSAPLQLLNLRNRLAIKKKYITLQTLPLSQPLRSKKSNSLYRPSSSLIPRLFLQCLLSKILGMNYQFIKWICKPQKSKLRLNLEEVHIQSIKARSLRG